MGCCLNSRHDLIEALESSTFTPLELDLGLYYHHSSVVDKCILKHSKSGVIIQSELQSFFEELKLKLSYNHRLFELFSERGEYNTVKIRTLFLMLTKGSIRTKSKILFEIYDKKAKRELESDDIFKILNNLIDISCKIFPIYATSLYPLHLELKGYVRYLNFAAPIVLRQYVLVFSTEAKLNPEQFEGHFRISTSAYLLSIKHLRMHAYHLYLGTLKPIEGPVERDSDIDTATINSNSRSTRQKLVRLRKFSRQATEN